MHEEHQRVRAYNPLPPCASFGLGYYMQDNKVDKTTLQKTSSMGFEPKPLRSVKQRGNLKSMIGNQIRRQGPYDY